MRVNAVGRDADLHDVLSILTWQAVCTKYLNYFSYGEAFLVERYQNGARQHLALRQLLISLIPLRSVISRWVINESSVDSVANNSSYLFHETNSHNGRQGQAPSIRFRSHARLVGLGGCAVLG